MDVVPLIIGSTVLIGVLAGWLRVSGWLLATVAGCVFLLGLAKTLGADPTDDTQGMAAQGALMWAVLWLTAASAGRWLRGVVQPTR